MNKMTQAALAALAFRFCSTAVYADGAEAASFGGGGGSGNGGSHHSGNSGCGTKCDGEIDIELTVAKHCDLDINKKKITMAQGANDKWWGDSSFDVSANAPYSLNITAPTKLTKAGAADIPITVKTKLGSADYSGATLGYQLAKRVFDVKVDTTNSVPYMTQAGTYTGVYKVAVAF